LNQSLKILFVSAFHAPFIHDDLDVLEKHFMVRRRIGHGIFHVIKIILSALSSDVIFCWFASVYASIAVAAGNFVGVKSIIVVGGVDVAKEKDLDYGLWLSPWRARLVRYALRHASRVLVVDPSLEKDATRLAEYGGENILYLPTAYDGLYWKPLDVKEPVVLTVATVWDKRRVRLKGIDVLIDAAQKLPAVQFSVVGVDPVLQPGLRPPKNVTFHGPLERKDLLPLYRRAKVYCQPSLREGLSNTLCEAMLCACIPIATDVGGNPTAVGDTGILIPPGNSEALVAAIQEALVMPEGVGAKARARIVALFPKEKRERELIRLVKELAG
jgi:glycosyltransferase involved in cell wall biosynthesis